MVTSVQLKIDGSNVSLPWTQFVRNIESTSASLKFLDQFDAAYILQCSILLFLMQVLIYKLFDNVTMDLKLQGGPE